MPPLWEIIAPYLKLIFLTVLPYIELRGGIPLGIGLGMDPLWVFIVCTGANLLIIFPIFLFLDLAFERFFRIGWIQRHVAEKVESVRRSGKRAVDRYGFPGLAVFVAIPLPGTGAYAGCLAAYLLRMDRRKAQIAIALGVLGAGIMVALASLGFFSAVRELGLGWIGGITILAAIGVILAYFRSRRKRVRRSI